MTPEYRQRRFRKRVISNMTLTEVEGSAISILARNR